MQRNNQLHKCFRRKSGCYREADADSFKGLVYNDHFLTRLYVMMFVLKQYFSDSLIDFIAGVDRLNRKLQVFARIAFAMLTFTNVSSFFFLQLIFYCVMTRSCIIIAGVCTGLARFG